MATEKGVEKIVQKMELSELMGNITRRIMDTLVTDNAAAKGAAINDCRRDLRLWYEAQTREDRRKFALDTRKALENFKLIGEQFFMEAVTITAQDL